VNALIRERALLSVLLACAITALAFAATASAAMSHWSIQASPQVNTGTLNSVSCTSSTACVAVGSTYFPSGSPRSVIVERWDGRVWSVEKLASPARAGSTLGGVSCPSRTDCIAVGSSGNKVLVERWNGRKWSFQRTPEPIGSTRSYLSAVSCPSETRCFAVGGYDNVDPLLERWNGSGWSIQSTAEPYGSDKDVGFDSISCTSQRACTAAGVDSNNNPVAERWDGAQWTVEKLRLANQGWSYLNDYEVSCGSRAACAAVGQGEADSSASYYWSIAEFWNGERWGHVSVQATNGSTAIGPGFFGVPARRPFRASRSGPSCSAGTAGGGR
jgi:hypothetical protein